MSDSFWQAAGQAAESDWLRGRPRQGDALVSLDDIRALVQHVGPREALSRLEGSFALSLALGDGGQLLAVDRFAIERLCWRRVADAATVAAHWRADHLADIAPAADIDPQALFSYFHFHVIPAPLTVFAGVHRLPAGHMALARGGEVRIEPYWQPRFVPEARPDFGSLKAEFRGLLQASVQRALTASPAACFLSGGTDSSTVAGMIRAATGEGADAFSIGFEAEGYDEMAYARVAAKAFGARHHAYYVTPDDLLRNIPAAAAWHDQPFGNSSLVPALCCAEQARSAGFDHLLAGDGGDELFGGNSRYAKQRVFSWYGGVPSALRGGLIEPVLLRSPLGRLPLLKKGASYVQQARVPMPDRLDLYNLVWRVGVDEVIGHRLLQKVQLDGPANLQRQVWQASKAGTELDTTLVYDWRFTLAENDLPKVTHATAQAGVGTAFPLLDQALVDFSLRLPADYKLRGMGLRWFFKEALRGFLPDEIITKKKHGFGLPFGVWAVRHAGLRALATDSLHGAAERGLLQPAFAQRLVGELLPSHPGYYGELVWIVMMMEQWFRRVRPGYRV
jgi:asparagine synthase (glutamine-hydrolysing)